METWRETYQIHTEQKEYRTMIVGSLKQAAGAGMD